VIKDVYKISEAEEIFEKYEIPIKRLNKLIAYRRNN